jgi:hypothetical protein
MSKQVKRGGVEVRRSTYLGNSALRDTAHQRLDEMLDLAEARQEYGIFSVDVAFEAGVITRIPQRFTRCDKPAA